MKVSKIKISTFAIVLMVAFSACSDSSDKKEDKRQASSNDAPKIEVVQNSDAHAIKVKEKQSDKSQSKSYYYDYNVKDANGDASTRVKPRTSMEANMNVRSPYEKVEISMLVKKLSKDFIVKCSACHDDYANGIVGPSLLGKDSDFIYNKIVAFKTGKESNPLMNDLVKKMDDKEIKKIAQEIYEFNKEITRMRNR
ncbi:hypothetical protein M947_01950 [Sulfurimonas hongkongensis]|uniref:Cytochrome c domain-containing protein n=1 Tax=Sulfurimonas hongkongensis TaxID=1172190 RepID=T0JQZ3_9BACT|nr:hypothetical protein [Sulfurimonas hongkongensis]EQB40591.1 hypothetical protein M947_01950 [Sulfurimonas hongkongensis]